MWNQDPDPLERMLAAAPALAAYRIAWLANTLTGPLYRGWEAREELSRPEFVVMLWLAEMPGLTAQQIAGPSSLPKNSISRAVGRLIRSGRITRRPHPQDSRAAILELTEAGDALLARLLPELRAREAAMLAPLSARERATLLALLGKLTRRADGWGRGEAP
jgi:DNA-binding MarR family transcriptional regulator